MSTIIDLVQLIVDLDQAKNTEFNRANELAQELLKERERTKELQTQLARHALVAEKAEG